ncbi:hypothetical protein IEQ34_026587 [Dendrobium chrysotoxum]|uniref:Secreted protein n=1 Tax=Dendrobium chrysotoxum TaxID=161865 RepID=A0AAV7FL85_DENCH|nr:hypothetical protein IEQ34_026587 [Dendrobium chrysotoxum]
MAAAFFWDSTLCPTLMTWTTGGRPPASKISVRPLWCFERLSRAAIALSCSVGSDDEDRTESNHLTAPASTKQILLKMFDFDRILIS